MRSYSDMLHAIGQPCEVKGRGGGREVRASTGGGLAVRPGQFGVRSCASTHPDDDDDDESGEHNKSEQDGPHQGEHDPDEATRSLADSYIDRACRYRCYNRCRK